MNMIVSALIDADLIVYATAMNSIEYRIGVCTNNHDAFDLYALTGFSFKLLF